MPIIDMPKALSKSKHGRKAGISEQPDSHSMDLAPKLTQGPVPSTKTSGARDPHSHRSNKHPSSSSRVEKQRDKVLKRICDKASGHLSASVVPKQAGSSSIEDTNAEPSGVQLDQVSLRDCPMVIQSDNLWGTAAPALPVVATEAAPATAMLPPPAGVTSILTPMGAGQGQDQAHNFLSPDQIQQMITTAIQQ